MFMKNSGNKLFQILSYCSTLLIEVHAMLINEKKDTESIIYRIGSN